MIRDEPQQYETKPDAAGCAPRLITMDNLALPHTTETTHHDPEQLLPFFAITLHFSGLLLIIEPHLLNQGSNFFSS